MPDVDRDGMGQSVDAPAGYPKERTDSPSPRPLPVDPGCMVVVATLVAVVLMALVVVG